MKFLRLSKTKLKHQNKVENMKIIYNHNLEDVLIKMISSTPSYFPSVVMDSGKVIVLMFKIGNIVGTIERSNNKDPEQKDIKLSQHVYEKYHVADDKLYSKLFLPEHMSQYHPNNLKLEKMCNMGPMCGTFSDKNVCNVDYIGVDSRKAYTSDFMDIKFYPVFSYFDLWQPYDNHEIEDYSQYLVNNTSNSVEDLILFPYTTTRIYGYVLNRIDLKRHNIIISAYKKPSKLVESNSADLINELWNTEISNDSREDSMIKKDIFNINSGLLDKKYNKRTFSKVFRSFDEAFYYQTKYGGKILKITDNENKSVFQDCNVDLFVLHRKEQIELENGFTPIKELIYSIRTLKNYLTTIKLHKIGIQACGIKTDSIIYCEKEI
jgi:hypothetical protein